MYKDRLWTCVHQSIQVNSNSIVSAKCYISKGVKQGGFISPTFLSVYLNGLIEKLRKNSIGCRYGSEYKGVFCYANDLSLPCPSFKCMWNICRRT